MSVADDDADQKTGIYSSEDTAAGEGRADNGTLQEPTPVAPPAAAKPDTKPCPLCGEEIKVVAIRCRHCNSDLTGSAAPAPANSPTPVVVLTAPPKQFLAGSVLCSLLLIGGAAWLLLVKIPQHDPEALGMAGMLDATLRDRPLLKQDYVQKAQILSVVLGLIGLLNLLGNSFREVGRVEYCAKCKTQVISRRRLFGRFACERCGTTLSGLVLAILRAFFLLGFIVTVGSAVAVFAAMNTTPSRGGGGRAQGSPAAPTFHQPPWQERAAKAADQLGRSTEAHAIGLQATKIAHPSGTFDRVSEWTLHSDPADPKGLAVRLVVKWKGGILGTEYTMEIHWRFNRSGHTKAEVASDDAPIGIGNAAPKLDGYFRESVYPKLKQMTGPGE